MSASAINIRNGLQNVQLTTLFGDNANDLSDIQGMKIQCQDYIEQLGYSYFSYCAHFPIIKSKQKISSFPLSWSDHEKHSIVCAENPVSQSCQSRTTPFFWEQMKSEATVSDDVASAFLDNAAQHGIYDGLCIPVHGAGSEWGMLNVAKSISNNKSTLETIHTLQLFAPTLHQAVKQVSANALKNSISEKSLSPRERECLNWIAAGKTAWETAQIIGITESTVAFHIRNTINKLNASNRAHAVAVGMARSLINGPLN